MENDCNNNNDDDYKKEKNKCLSKINELSHSLSNDSMSKCIVWRKPQAQGLLGMDWIISAEYNVPLVRKTGQLNYESVRQSMLGISVDGVGELLCCLSSIVCVIVLQTDRVILHMHSWPSSCEEGPHPGAVLLPDTEAPERSRLFREDHRTRTCYCIIVNSNHLPQGV